MYVYSRIVLMVAGLCVASGGLYDVCTPRLPPNLASKCFGNEDAGIVIRELLRALGGCLVAIGVTVGILATTVGNHNTYAIALILILVLPSEAMNAIGMHRVGSPYFVPLFFILLTLAGAALGLLSSNAQ